MAGKSRPVFLMLGGGYLIYTGSRLISEVMKSHPTSENLFIAFGAFFVIFGVLIVGVNLKKLYDLTKKEKDSDVIIEDIEFLDEREELPARKKRSVKKQVAMMDLKVKGEAETIDSEKTDTEEFQEKAEEKQSSENETDDQEILDDDDIDDNEYDDEYDDDEYDDDEYDDEYEEDTEAADDEDFFKIKLERI